jgi:hypothetical protein
VGKQKSKGTLGGDRKFPNDATDKNKVAKCFIVRSHSFSTNNGGDNFWFQILCSKYFELSENETWHNAS